MRKHLKAALPWQPHWSTAVNSRPAPREETRSSILDNMPTHSTLLQKVPPPVSSSDLLFTCFVHSNLKAYHWKSPVIRNTELKLTIQYWKQSHPHFIISTFMAKLTAPLPSVFTEPAEASPFTFSQPERSPVQDKWSTGGAATADCQERSALGLAP